MTILSQSIFEPRAVAVVGVSNNSDGRTRANFVEGFIAHRFTDIGEVYPVNRNALTIGGLKCYPSLLECPDPVDHVIVQVRADYVLDVVKQCVQKGVHSVHIYTAGFREQANSVGGEHEQEIARLARDNGIALFGPNCLGLYSPRSRVTFAPNLPRDGGEVFLLSQSGSLTGAIIGALARRELYISKAVSFGNACDVDAADLLQFAATDPDTEVIAGYIEGTQDGRRLYRALGDAARSKPTVLLNGGGTETGSASATTHTGSLAVADHLFRAMTRQAGAIKVDGLSELIDTVAALSSSLVGARGGRAAVVGAGGGQSVLACDALARRGSAIPTFTPELVSDLHKILGAPPGASLVNPIDQAVMRVSNDPHLAAKALEQVAERGGVDFIVLLLGGGWGGHWRGLAEPDVARTFAEEFARALAAIQEASGTPIVCISGDGDGGPLPADQDFQRAARRGRLAVFPSIERAACAIENVLRWSRFHERK